MLQVWLDGSQDIPLTSLAACDARLEVAGGRVYMVNYAVPTEPGRARLLHLVTLRKAMLPRIARLLMSFRPAWVAAKGHMGSQRNSGWRQRLPQAPGVGLDGSMFWAFLRDEISICVRNQPVCLGYVPGLIFPLKKTDGSGNNGCAHCLLLAPSVVQNFPDQPGEDSWSAVAVSSATSSRIEMPTAPNSLSSASLTSSRLQRISPRGF